MEEDEASVANIIPFYNFSTLLQKLETPITGKEKGAYLKKYFNHYREQYNRKHGTLDPIKANVNDSIFCLARILLPTEDKKRTAYGLKGTRLAGIYAKILGLDRNSEDGRKLLDFKDPTNVGNRAGNLGQILYDVLKTRASHDQSSDGPSIGELHHVLDLLSQGQTKILQSFIRRLTPIEAKWFTRIVCKSLYLGLTTSRIFKCVHDNAEELYLRIGNLEKVCIRCNDANAVIDFTTIELFEPFKPMLCARLNVIKETKKNSTIEKAELPHPPFLLEIKWDGERCQLHYDSSKPANDQFRYFSRNSNDFTSSYQESLTPRLKAQIKSSCKSFILDGEMMSYKKSTGGFTQQGREVEVRKLKADDPIHCPTFIAFDIVFLNGESLTETPLRQRMKILKEHRLAVEPQEGIIHFSEQRIIQAKEQVMDALNDAVDALEEGLVVKELESKYLVGQRDPCWLKIKPEFFVDTSVDDLDMIILGGYVTDGQQRRSKAMVNHFVVGVLDEFQRGHHQFLPVAQVGAGSLRNPDLEKLVDNLQPNFVRKEVSNGIVNFKGIKRPNFYIDPKKSIVVQVKATEFIFNHSMVAQYTLRFPRISAVRRDKSWRDIMTLKELHELQATYRGKLAKRNDGQVSKNTTSKYTVRRPKEREESPKKQPRLSHTPSPPPPTVRRSQRQQQKSSAEEEPQPGCSHWNTQNYKTSSYKSKGLNHNNNNGPKVLFPISPSKIVRNIFDLKVFHVIGYSDFVGRVKKEIHENGGRTVENAKVKDLFAIIAEKISARADRCIKDGLYDVLKYSWLEKCLLKKNLEPILPEDCWGMGKERKKIMANDYDMYGDAFRKPTTCINVKKLLTDIIAKEDEEEHKQEIAKSRLRRRRIFQSDSTDDDENDDVPVVNPSIQKLDLRLIKRIWDEEFDEAERRKLQKYNFLNDCKIAVRGEIDFSLKSKIEFYGGQVTDDERENDVTHVLVMDGMSSSNHSSAFVVKPKWILDSIQSRKLFDECFYQVIR